jgi:hypothetical protein
MKLGEDYIGCRVDDKTEYFFVTEKLHVGLIPQILTESLNYREKVKKEMKIAKSAGDINKAKMLNGKQLAIKVTANSAYGNFGTGTRGKLPCAAIAACVTAVGRNVIFTTQKMVEEKFKEQGAEVIYGDSVPGDTPILLKLANGSIVYREISEIAKFPEDCKCDKTHIDVTNIEVWSDKGWTQIQKVMRHRTTKRLYRIVTGTGLVDVTEDHSLLLSDGTPVKPNDVKIGTDLLHKEFPMSDNILFNYSGRTNLPDSVFHVSFAPNQSPKCALANMAYISNWLGDRFSFSFDGHAQNDDSDFHDINFKIIKKKLTDDERKERTKIKKIIDLGVTTDYVYDLTTENHHFAAGIGNLVVHNTDSVMVKLNNVGTEDSDAEQWFKYGYEMAKMATKHFGKTMSLEMEKLWQPYLLLKKKRYCGVKRESLQSQGEIAYSGIELKKSDSTEFLKMTYSQMLDALFKEKSVIRCVQVLQERLSLLHSGKVKYEDFVLSKNLKPESQYKNKNTTQLVVAQKMKKRNPTDYPKSGDKVRFVVIQHPDPKKLICDKAEDIQYAKEKNLELDLEYYLEHTLINPITQLMDAFHSNPEKLFEETRRILQNKKTKQNTLQGFGVTVRSAASSLSDEQKIVKDLKMTKLDSSIGNNKDEKKQPLNSHKPASTARKAPAKKEVKTNSQALLNMISAAKK